MKEIDYPYGYGHFLFRSADVVNGKYHVVIYLRHFAPVRFGVGDEFCGGVGDQLQVLFLPYNIFVKIYLDSGVYAFLIFFGIIRKKRKKLWVI